MAQLWKCLVGVFPFFALSAVAFGQVQVSGPVGHAAPMMPASSVAPTDAALAAPFDPAALPASLKSDELSARDVVKLNQAGKVVTQRHRIDLETDGDKGVVVHGTVKLPAISWIDGRPETSNLAVMPLAESLNTLILESVQNLPGSSPAP